MFGQKPGAAKRKPWQLPTGAVDRRLRGRAGVKQRDQVKSEEPFCRLCLLQGKQVATDEVDHIKPLSAGGTNARSNLQGLCQPHHDAKSKAERGAGRRD